MAKIEIEIDTGHITVILNKWINRLSTAERDKPLIVTGGTEISPRQMVSEIERGTELGKRLLQSLVEAHTLETLYTWEKKGTIKGLDKIHLL